MVLGLMSGIDSVRRVLAKVWANEFMFEFLYNFGSNIGFRTRSESLRRVPISFKKTILLWLSLQWLSWLIWSKFARHRRHLLQVGR